MNGHNGHTGNGGGTDGGAAAGHEFERSRPGASSGRNAPGRGAPSHPASDEDTAAFSVDAMSLLRPASRRWYWVLLGGLLGAGLGVAAGLWLWKPYYTATAQIVRLEPPLATDAYRPQPVSGYTLVGMIQSPEVFKKLGRKHTPPLSGAELAARVRVLPERQSEIITISTTANDPASAVNLANLFNQEVITFTQEYQRNEAQEADVYVAQQLQETEADIAVARREIPAAPFVNALDPVAPAVIADRRAEKIGTAREELALLLVTYTDNHPRVKQKRAEMAALEAQVPARILQDERFSAERPAGVARPVSQPAAASSREEQELTYYHLRTQEQLRSLLINRQRAIQVFKDKPPGNFKVMQAAGPETVAAHNPKVKVALVGAFFGILGMVFAAGELLRRELFDNRLKTASDVKRVTGLPVLASIGDLRPLSLAAREAWAFRTWIALQDRLAHSPNHGLICGFTSSNSGDGRSTWISLLAGAARKCGFRVLTIATRSSVDGADPSHESAAEVAAESAAERFEPATAGVNGHAKNTTAATYPPRHLPATSNYTPSARGFAGESNFTSLTANALFTPAMVTAKLTGPETDPLVHIPLPGWTWNLERRKQWQGALNVWRKIDNVVILVELPPASMAESVLLASNLPNLVWMVESGKSEATETRAQLQTLRHARCNLVGAVINRALKPMTEGRFSRWVGGLALFGVLGLCTQNLRAAAPAPVAATGTFSIVSPTQRAAWQQKLTLGPGDILNLSLYGDSELTREEVPVGPDGRISYLEAQNLIAAGLTVDEFRDRLNEELGKYRRSPQAYVVPLAYNSKKYYMLGKVSKSGSYTLDRPLTLIEAVARANGIETGIGPDRSLVELADLSRSFIARGGQHLPVNFEKLFLEGDLTQNVALEPNDYIYFPSAAQKEVYVLGAVQSPGPYVYTSATGALGAIAARGGFTEKAWKNRMLVIRGSLEKPQTFVIDATDILNARSADLKLQPRDIVFVSDRPWARAEDLLEAATSAFVTSAVVVWTGLNVHPTVNR